MTDRLTKRDLVAKIAERTGLTKTNAENALEAFLEEVQDVLARSGKISLVGFGTFEVAERKARKGRNPKSGENIEIPATRVPRFKAGKGLKDKVK